mmetsp:Transcript_39264/g.124020  ORF Transcript_39264/g.124020 Transcript_39264/m.124020 type:complete len:248 (+) Transcript_39264:452-1195(+)
MELRLRGRDRAGVQRRQRGRHRHEGRRGGAWRLWPPRHHRARCVRRVCAVRGARVRVHQDAQLWRHQGPRVFQGPGRVPHRGAAAGQPRHQAGGSCRRPGRGGRVRRQLQEEVTSRRPRTSSHAAVASRAGRVGAVPVCIMAALSLFLASSQFRFERQQSWTSGGIHCMTIEAQMSIHGPGGWRAGDSGRQTERRDPRLSATPRRCNDRCGMTRKSSSRECIGRGDLARPHRATTHKCARCQSSRTA